MSKEKQIEEMAKALTNYEYKLCERLPKDKCLLTSAVHAQVSCDYCKISEFLYNAGYRKQGDVAREIFGEILLNHTPDIDGFFTMHKSELAELKKKYTEESENGR